MNYTASSETITINDYIKKCNENKVQKPYLQRKKKWSLDRNIAFIRFLLKVRNAVMQFVFNKRIIDSKEVNILVELHQTKVVIYSKTTQNYHVVNAVDASVGTSRWLCKDSDGKSCYVAMHFDERYAGLITLAVEYNDLVWFYICNKE